MILIAVFGILILLSKINLKKRNNLLKKYYEKIIALFIIGLSTINIIQNSAYSIKIIREETSDLKEGSYSTVIRCYNEAINNLKNYDNSIYRTEKVENLSTNDALMFGYNSISFSASTYSKSLYNLLWRLGIEEGHVSVKYGIENTKAVDMLLGIKYIMQLKDKEFIKKYAREYEDRLFEVYKNPYYLSIGYGVSKNISNVNMNEENTFEFQNDILKKMTEIEEEVYISQKRKNFRNYTRIRKK